MKRREILMRLAGGMAWPAFARSQDKVRRPRIGVLMPGTEASYVGRLASLRRGLGEHGYVEPQTIELVLRYGTEPNRLSEFARELIAMGVDLILTNATAGGRAAMAATSTIPIVIAAAADVVGTGLVASLAKPGGNVTGMTILIPDLARKQIELIKEFVPEIRKIGFLRGRNEGG
jgi:putative tryptophan/tyrosine transport system substrate-binding protein